MTFLELFYDLVYVALIAQLSHALVHHITWVGIGEFSFLFVLVWWAWLNGSLYHDVHGNDDIRTRVFTFLQMATVVMMAIFAHDAMGDTSRGFALSYAGFQLILTFLWWRTGVHDPDHRPLSGPYSAVFLLNTVLFAGSIFIAPPARFYLWALAFVLSLILPTMLIAIGRRNPEARKQLEIGSSVSPSLSERFGLLTIIVLGEIVFSVVSGAADHHDITWELGTKVMLGTLLAVGIWWTYFDTVSSRLPRPGMSNTMRWFYLHLPMTAGITVIGASILYMIEHEGDHLPDGVRWSIIVSLSIVLVSIALLVKTLQIAREFERPLAVGRKVLPIAAILLLPFGLLDLGATQILVITNVLLFLPIIAAMMTWMRGLIPEEMDELTVNRRNESGDENG